MSEQGTKGRLITGAPDEEGRPDQSGARAGRGKLKVFFGYAAGVGKTYAMLDEARELQKSAIDVVVGYIDSEASPETLRLLEGLPAIGPDGASLLSSATAPPQFDLDAALKRRPAVILVDQLEHTNGPGARNKRRYQDIEELLAAGIDVYTTLSVQHLSSLNYVASDITKADVAETVPDSIFDRADKVKIIDIEPDELLRRLSASAPAATPAAPAPSAPAAPAPYALTRDDLCRLREITMRKAAWRISHSNTDNTKARQRPELNAGSKLMVCVSDSPSSAKCVRWAARLAEAFFIPWVAVYVEDVDQGFLSAEQLENKHANLKLADCLGGEVLTLSGVDVAEVVAEYARLSGITNIVIGKSQRRRWLRPAFEDRLIARLPDSEIHIVPNSVPSRAASSVPTNVPGSAASSKRPKQRQQPQQPQQRQQRQQRMRASLTWTDAAKSLLILALATGLSFILKFFAIGDQNIIMMYMLAVLVISRITNGLVYGVAASVISVLVFNFFFTHPVFSFSATAPGYPVTFVIMLLAALIISTLTVRVKTQVKLAAKREQRTKTLYEISCKLLVTRGTRQIADLINSYIVQIFSRSVVFYTDPDSPEPPAALAKGPEDTALLYSEDERSVATWSFVNQKPAGAGTDTHAGAGLYYLPVVSEGRSLGVIGVSCARGVPGVNSKFFLQLIVAQAAMALERQGLSDAQSQATVLSEKEKLRNNLLRAISHDLRTPLTVIHGASSTILENADALSEGEKRELLNNIKDDSGWLIRMVENLLFVTRLIDSGTGLVKATEAVEEIISETIGRIAKRFPEARVAVSMPDEVLLLPMDGTLIEQVLLNLLENAIKHNVKNQEITIRVEKDGRKVWFRVEDLGSGILEGDLPQLFNGFADPKPSPDSARGFGVGLSICKSIIDAHDGQIMAENNKGGGATFSFWLPQEGDMSGE